MTSKLKVGDRVKFTGEGTVLTVCSDGYFCVGFDGHSEINGFQGNLADKFTIIPKPIKVGDMVTWGTRDVNYTVIGIHEGTAWLHNKDVGECPYDQRDICALSHA